mgnify:CR=1 FL=1
MKIRGQIKLKTAADGHMILSLSNRGLFNTLMLRFKLQLRHGFSRKGRHILLPDEGIGPDYIRGNISLKTGYDEFGLYLLAINDEGDSFLRSLAKELA